MTTLSQGRTALYSALASVVFMVLLCYFFEPIWETRDDIQMAMLAHGFGLGTYASSEILFSNVIWGDLVRSLPTIRGVLGYSIATLLTLGLSATALVYALVRLGLGYITSILMLFLLFARPILFPQFTINAGISTLVAVLLLHVYAREKQTMILIVSMIFAFVGFLIRAEEFILVSLVALPILPWEMIKKDKAVKVACFFLLIGLTSASLYNKTFYEQEEWAPYFEINQSRGALSDFGAVERLVNKPEIHHQYGFSENDLNILETSFFFDKDLADVNKLTAMLDELGPNYSIKKAWRAIRPLYRSHLIPLVACGLILLLLWPNPRVFLAWALCLAGLALIGSMGRPGILRIYVPLLSLLCLAPMLFIMTQTPLKNTVTHLCICLCVIMNSYNLFNEQSKVALRVQDAKEVMRVLGCNNLVIWGGALDSAAVFPLLNTHTDYYRCPFTFIAWSVLTPQSLAAKNEKMGQGFLYQLSSSEGVKILMDEFRASLLEKYCHERQNSELVVSNIIKYPELKAGKHVTLATYQCL